MKRSEKTCIEKKREEREQRVDKLIIQVVKSSPRSLKKTLTDDVAKLSGVGWYYIRGRVDDLITSGVLKQHSLGGVSLGESVDEKTNLTIQDLVREYRQEWEAMGQWQEPDLADCLDWMATEVGEAIDARLRLTSDYTRNNPRSTTRDDVAVEVFDVIMMGCVALDLLGQDLFDVARRKLKEMDVKRSGKGDTVLRPIGELVLVDLEKRLDFGKEKYGGELLPFDDDVSPLLDAYEEALDLSLYLRQAIEEKRLLQGGYCPKHLPRRERSVDES